jgi:hypothetical protein
LIYDNYKTYTINPNYVYKSFYDSKNNEHWIAILKKTTFTITNECRRIPNSAQKNNLKYRANELQVILIFNKKNPNYIIDKYVHKKTETNLTVYEKGKTVRSANYDIYDWNICSGGIHYFLNLECAFYWNFGFNLNNIQWYYLDYDN